MKKFHFNLESVQTLRLRQEQDATSRYAQALLNQQQAALRLEKAQRELNDSWQELRRQLRGSCTALAAAAQSYHRSQEKRVEECVSALRIEEIRVNGALKELCEAKRLSEIVDKFFEKQRKRHDSECSVEDQKFMDHFGSRSGNPRLAGRHTESVFDEII